MSDISQLLKEARPLYFKRKRQRRIIKNASVGGVCLGLLLAIFPMNTYKMQSDIYSYLYDDVLYESSYMTELETQDSFYPIDEYGLIQV